MSMVKKWLAVFAVASVALAGCSGDDGGAGDPPENAMTEDDFGDRALAAVDEAGNVEMTTVQALQGQESTTNGALSWGDGIEELTASLTVEGPQGEDEAIFVDGVSYAQSPLAEDEWIREDLGDLGEQADALYDQIHPGRQLATLQEAAIGLEATGETEDIDGVEAHHYVLTVDAEEFANAAGMETGGGGAEELEYQLWIDDRDLPMRIEFSQDGVEATSTFTQWGQADVDVEAPPEDSIVDADEVQQDMEEQLPEDMEAP